MAGVSNLVWKTMLVNPLTTNIPHRIETSQLICVATQSVLHRDGYICDDVHSFMCE